MPLVRWPRMFNSGDPAWLEEWFSPDFVNHNPSWGMRDDRQGFGQYVEAIRSAFPDLRFTVGQVIAEDETVAAYLTATGTHQGQFWGVEPTGSRVSFSTVWIARFTQDQVSEWWSTWDWWQLMQQIGVSPQTPEEVTPQY